MPEKPLVIRTPMEMTAFSAARKAAGEAVGFVPTMGALHAGHLSLLDVCHARAACSVVSIFVNPMQFDKKDDLDQYPRTWDRDMALLSEKGVAAVYYPNVEVMYPKGFVTKVSVSRMTEGLCGAARPGHFDGVTTVVLKLFNAVRPDFAVFGEKDYQQLKTIERMTSDLDLGIEIVPGPIVREPDGLAMSSRNVRLSAEQRERSLCLYRALNAAKKAAHEGETKVESLVGKAGEIINGVNGAKTQYISVVDADSLEPLNTLDRPARMCLAVRLGPVYLIDNISLD